MKYKPGYFKNLLKESLQRLKEQPAGGSPQINYANYDGPNPCDKAPYNQQCFCYYYFNDQQTIEENMVIVTWDGVLDSIPVTNQDNICLTICSNGNEGNPNNYDMWLDYYGGPSNPNACCDCDEFLEDELGDCPELWVTLPQSTQDGICNACDPYSEDGPGSNCNQNFAPCCNFINPCDSLPAHASQAGYNVYEFCIKCENGSIEDEMCDCCEEYEGTGYLNPPQPPATECPQDTWINWDGWGSITPEMMCEEYASNPSEADPNYYPVCCESFTCYKCQGGSSVANQFLGGCPTGWTEDEDPCKKPQSGGGVADMEKPKRLSKRRK